MLKLCVCNNYFVFNGSIYTQLDGVSMGNSLGPVLANVFLSHLEETYFKENAYFPQAYMRYVDDTFCLFSDKSHIQHFLEYINSVHPNITFTVEFENNNTLEFLDTCVNRNSTMHNHISINMKHKSTDRGLFFHFDSFVPLCYKVNLIRCLVFRIYKFCTDWSIITCELQKLKIKLKSNGFPSYIIDNTIYKFLENLHYPSNVNQSKSDEQNKGDRLILVLPYLGPISCILKRKVTRLINKYFPKVRLNVVFRRGYNLSSLFQFKDRLPLSCRSFVVYYSACTGKTCEPRGVYIGKTKNTLYERFFSSNGHLNPKTATSAFLEHKIQSKSCEFSFDEVKILAQARNDYMLRIMESIHLKFDHQNLNDDTINTAKSSIKLKLF